ncbi:hypothetical protein CPB84DRAFT_1795913 [Gymnopilus junonius]|uniref:Uncharacterized protein n=1 Tax=Gymnopilus junonius TaxID=109634 RepID=A0A9P5NCA4_GYMJU|nr:hypothetical protein CPB84DRAFT_1795913 [Gymnopilus junonius]
MAPFSAHGSLPSAVSLPWKNDSVYLLNSSEVKAEKFIAEDMQAAQGSLFLTSRRFPRWGIRINCLKIPDMSDNIIPISANNFTYLFTPRETLRLLFQGFGLPFPLNFEKLNHIPAGLNQSQSLWEVSTTVAYAERRRRF